MRRNLRYEVAYSACNGVVSGLALLAQITVIGSLGGGAAAVAVLTAALPGSSLIHPLWAEAARRYRLKSLALCSGALRCLPLLLIAGVAEPWLFTALIVLFNLCGGPVTLAVPSLYKYTYADSHRGRIIGVLRTVQHGVAIPAMLGSAWLMDREPWLYQVLYPVAGLVGLLGLVFYQRLDIPTDCPRDRAQLSERATLQSIRKVLHTDANFRLFQTTIFLTGAGFLMSRAILIYLLRDDYHLSQLELSFLVQVMPVVLSALTSPAWGAFMDRTSPVAGRVAFAWLGVFAYAALFASFYWHWLALAYTGAVLRGMVLGAAEVSLTTGNLYFSVRPERAALYESISSLFQGIRGLCMPLVGYLLFLQLHAFLFLVPTVLNAWSLVLAVKLWRRDREEGVKSYEVIPGRPADELGGSADMP
jgi:hypothetical protein